MPLSGIRVVDNDAALQESGYTAEAIAALRAVGVVWQSPGCFTPRAPRGVARP